MQGLLVFPADPFFSMHRFVKTALPPPKDIERYCSQIGGISYDKCYFDRFRSYRFAERGDHGAFLYTRAIST